MEITWRENAKKRQRKWRAENPERYKEQGRKASEKHRKYKRKLVIR